MNSECLFVKITLTLLIILIVGCQSPPDFDKLKSEITALHEAEIKAHWKKDVDFLIRDISDEYLSVSNGEIHNQTVEEIKNSFTSYLNNSDFSEYKDLREPIIGFSKDGSLAWAIFQIKVTGKHQMTDGSEGDLDFTCAWMTLFERQDDRWIRLTDVSTFK
jgi:hypothetical protein